MTSRPGLDDPLGFFRGIRNACAITAAFVAIGLALRWWLA